MAQLLLRWPDTDAVVCVSDHLAFGALAECQRLGWAVPDRLAIAGFGGFAVGSACHAGRRHRTACAAVQPFAPHGAGPARRARQAGKPAESSCATFDKTVR